MGNILLRWAAGPWEVVVLKLKWTLSSDEMRQKGQGEGQLRASNLVEAHSIMNLEPQSALEAIESTLPSFTGEKIEAQSNEK